MSYPTLCFLAYERPQFLKQAITTALAGVDEPVEIIVHDDGSEDPEQLKLLHDLHLTGCVSSLVLNAPGVNQGQGVALNRMFRMASGDPIIKLDHDLVFEPGWLRTVKAILEDQRVGLCALFKYWLDPVDWRKTRVPDEDVLACGEGLPQGYSFHTHIIGSGFAVPRRVWDILGPFEERWESFGEDWDFQKRVHEHPCLFNALPDQDLVSNVGFGLGPSTVVVAGENGVPEPRKIHKQPVLVGGRR